jgi:hypothetical protein
LHEQQQAENQADPTMPCDECGAAHEITRLSLGA